MCKKGVVLLFFLSFFLQDYAFAADRIALVIGNSKYKSHPLRNPENDAKDMARALEDLGFNVIDEINCSRKRMKALIRKFSDQLSIEKKVGLFYYAGHGLQYNGENYLIPVDHDIQDRVDLEDEAVNAQWVLKHMQSAGSRVNIVILDACRKEPIGRSLDIRGNRGLAVMTAPVGSFIAYATKDGGVAEDGTGRNGVYTKHLLRHIKNPELDINEVFRVVREGVFKETKKRQLPFDYTSMIGRFYFNPSGGLKLGEVKLGLIANYRFDGDVRDSSKYDRHGNLLGASFDFDRKNRAKRSLRFNGRDDCVRGFKDLNINEHTISTWIKHNGSQHMEKNQRIVGKVKPYEFESFTLGITENFKLMTNFATGSEVNHLLVGKQRLKPNRWYHVAMTYDGTKVFFYVDGELDSTHPRTGVVRTNNNYLAIGRHCGDSDQRCAIRAFDGAIDDVRIYNRALNSSEIGKIYRLQ